MKKKIFGFAALISSLCLVVSGCGQNKTGNTVPTLKAYEFGKNDVVKTLKVSGEVESTEKNSTITTELVNCKVKTLNVSVGDRVKKDDILCELDTSEIEKEIADLEKLISDSRQLSDYDLDQYKQNLEKTKKNGNEALDDAQSKIDDAKKALEDQKSLSSKYYSAYEASLNAAEEAKNAAENAESEEEAAAYSAEYQEYMKAAGTAMASYEAAQAGISQAESAVKLSENMYSQTKKEVDSSISSAQYQVDRYSLASGGTSEDQKKLDDLKSQLEKAVIRAEKDGIVAAVIAEEGKTCQNGIIMTLQSAADMCVHVVISEEDLLDVESGMKATITIPARDKEEYSGAVDRVIDIKSQNGFDGYINIDDPTDFRIGMSAKAEIVINDSSDQMSVRNSSVFKNTEQKDCVYEAEKQGDGTYKIREVEVETGIRNDQYTVVSGEGLDEGDIIIIAPSRCKDGDIINVSLSEAKAKTSEAGGSNE